MMKKLIFILLTAALFMISCAKDEPTKEVINISITDGIYTFSLAAESEYTLSIFSKSGNRVFETTFKGKQYAWDAKTSNGTSLAEGMYLYTISNSDKSVNQEGYFYIVSSNS